jgi:hypothetical protein
VRQKPKSIRELVSHMHGRTDYAVSKYSFSRPLLIATFFVLSLQLAYGGDSKGSSRPIPWQTINSGGAGAHLGALF